LKFEVKISSSDVVTCACTFTEWCVKAHALHILRNQTLLEMIILDHCIDWWSY